MKKEKKILSNIASEELYLADTFIPINKKALTLLGINASLFLSNLISYHKTLKQKKECPDDWFFYTHEEQMKRTNLSVRNIRSAKNQLKEIGVLYTEIKGIPPKEWYFIDFAHLVRILRIK